MIRALTAGSFRYWPLLRSTNNVIGTPHARWRLSTQSGRPSTIAPIRLRPLSGTKRVSAIASSASSRNDAVGPETVAAIAPSTAPSAATGNSILSSGRSIGTNHCGVQR